MFRDFRVLYCNMVRVSIRLRLTKPEKKRKRTVETAAENAAKNEGAKKAPSRLSGSIPLTSLTAAVETVIQIGLQKNRVR